MKLDQQRYEETLQEERHKLALASPFKVQAGHRRKKGTRTTDHKPKSAGNSTGGIFEEAEHPRNPLGEFIDKGDSGAAVKAVQKAVGAKEDGEYGKSTVQAIRKYQRENDLQVDGIVGQQTAASLLGNEKAPDITPGVLRPGQVKRLLGKTKKKKK